MNILSLDLSLTATGYCSNAGPGTLKIPNGLRGPARLAHIRDEVGMLALNSSSSLVVIEGYSYGSKGRSVVNIGELGGVIRTYLWDWDITYVEVPPTNLKRYATGRGNSSKDDVLQAGVIRSGYTFPDNNACDAWWLYQMALAHYEPESPLLVKMPKGNLEALDKVPWPEVGR